MRALSYSEHPLPRSRLHRHERILHRVLLRRRAQARWLFIHQIARVLLSFLKAILRGGELVRYIAPNRPPQRRHEFDAIPYFPQRWV